jgi:hypothetical protein
MGDSRWPTPARSTGHWALRTTLALPRCRSARRSLPEPRRRERRVGRPKPDPGRFLDLPQYAC